MTAPQDGPAALRARLRAVSRQMFAALGHRDYRRYITGQTVSLVGTWMQTVAQGWLVLQLTGSGTAIGILVAVQSLPVLLLGPYAGLLADRLDKRTLIIRLQIVMGALAAVLGVLTATSVVQLWQVYLLAAVLGVTTALENPARQTFVLDLVGPDLLRDAVGLSSVLVNVARAIGPAAAGVLISIGGLPACFLINAASYVVVVVTLLRLDRTAVATARPAARGTGQLRAGLSAARRRPELLVPLGMMAVIGCLAYEFQVVLPVLASQTFAGDARAYGFMTASMGIGAIVGGLVAAARRISGPTSVVRAAAGFGLAIAAAAFSPTLPVVLVALAAVGAMSVSFLARGNSTLQLAAEPQMRGRVMALWTMALLGTTPIGGPLAGAVSDHLGARAGLLLGAIGCLAAAAWGATILRRRSAGTAPSTGRRTDGR